MKRQSILPVLAGVVALGLCAGASAQVQSVPLYFSLGMSAPGVQVGVSNVPQRYPPPVVYAPPAPVAYAYGYPGGYRRPEVYGYGGAPVRYGFAPAFGGYGRDRDDVYRHAWRHERFEHERFGHEGGHRF